MIDDSCSDSHQPKRPRNILKTNPCEACRDHKRKCSMGVPCERCRSLGLECIYIVTKPPDDEEYFQIAANLQARAEFEQLRQQMDNMEIEIERLKELGSSAQKMDKISSPASSDGDSPKPTDVKVEPNLLDDVKCFEATSPPSCSSPTVASSQSPCRSESESSTSSPKSLSPLETISHTASSEIMIPVARGIKCISLSSEILADSDDNDQPLNLDWNVVFKRNGLSIHTNINKFQDLLSVLAEIINKTTDSMHIPADFLKTAVDRPFGYPNYIRRTKSSNFRIRNEPMELMKRAAKNPDKFKIVVPSLATNFTAKNYVNELVHRLMDLYWSCFCHHSPHLHKPSFVARYYNHYDPLQSHAVAAICAFMTNVKCLHVRSLIPPNLIVQFGEYFYTRARNQIDDLFDEEDSLETFIALFYVGQYKYFALQIKSAFMFQGHVRRLAEPLMKQYGFDNPNRVHDPDFVGQRECFRRICFALRFANKGMRFVMETKGHGIAQRLNLRRRVGYPQAQPDEDPLAQRALLATSMFFNHMENAKNIRIALQWEGEVPFEIVERFEIAMKSYYASLPEDFKIDLPLFPSMEIESVIRKVLDRDKPDRYAVLLLCRFYTNWMCMHEPFALGPGEDEEMASGQALRSQAICTRAAELVTILWDYHSKQWPCFMDTRSLLTACDLHYRNAASHDAEQAVRSKRMILTTLKIARRGYLRWVDKKWLDGLTLGDEEEESETEGCKSAGVQGTLEEEEKIRLEKVAAEEALCKKL
ncbi:hypothetical protein BC937DRAFT_94710, partial [Endogone sp. FLAS-F59071]